MLYYTNLDKTVLGMQQNTASSNNIAKVSQVKIHKRDLT